MPQAYQPLRVRRKASVSSGPSTADRRASVSWAGSSRTHGGEYFWSTLFIPSVLLGVSNSTFGGGTGSELNDWGDRLDFDALAWWEIRNLGLGDRAQPSFVGRRQQHMHATASTAMRYRPAAPGDQAGITAFQNDDYYYLLTVTLANDQPVVQLEKKAGGTAEIVASAPLDLPADGTVYLKIDADADTYRFSYALNPEDWITLGDAADGKILSTQTAGGFVGALFGLYASTRTP